MRSDTENHFLATADDAGFLKVEMNCLPHSLCMIADVALCISRYVLVSEPDILE